MVTYKILLSRNAPLLTNPNWSYVATRAIEYPSETDLETLEKEARRLLATIDSPLSAKVVSYNPETSEVVPFMTILPWEL